MTWSAPTTMVQAQTAGQIEASRQSTKITSGFGGGMREATIVLSAEALQHSSYFQSDHCRPKLYDCGNSDGRNNGVVF
jgi:hypothetical protein